MIDKVKNIAILSKNSKEMLRPFNGLHEKKMKQHKCDKRVEKYSQKSHLNEHILRFHENIKSLPCSESS